MSRTWTPLPIWPVASMTMTSQLPFLSNPYSATLPITRSVPVARSRTTRSDPRGPPGAVGVTGGCRPGGSWMPGGRPAGAAAPSPAFRYAMWLADSPANWKTDAPSISVFSAVARFTSTIFGFGRVPPGGIAPRVDGVTENPNHFASNENVSDPNPAPPGYFV